jgi:glutathione S-transferase
VSLTLVIGTKRWSSWSLRPWIALKQAQIPFTEVVIPLRRDDTKARLAAWSPAAKAPVLIDGDIVVWESLAILDYVSVRFPEREWWPKALAARAAALSIAAEMHAGFASVRRELPMDVLAGHPTPALSAEARSEIARIESMWTDARARFGGEGPFLFGRFCNADAMYAPVASRMRTYGVPLAPVCRDYVDAILGLPAFAEWRLTAAEPDE